MIKPLIFVLVIALAADGCSGEKKDDKKKDSSSTDKNTEQMDTKGEEKITSDSKVEVPVISTDYGDIYIWLYEDTPKHKENFLKLTKEGFYDGTTFHRVINNFMIQGGDPNSKDDNPNNDGQGGPGYTLPAEINPEYSHTYGTVAAARKGDQVNPKRASSGSQFYIVDNPNGAHHLDRQYTVFGKVIKGMDVVEAISEQKVDRRARPIEDIPMQVEVKEFKVNELQEKFDFTPPAVK